MLETCFSTVELFDTLFSMNTFSGDHYQVWSHATVVSLSLVYQPLQVTHLEQAVLPTHPDSNDS